MGLVELALSGCTTVADHQYHYYPGMPFDASAVVFEEADSWACASCCAGAARPWRAR
jgi:hypothetical protein